MRTTSPFFRARVLRAMIRVLDKMMQDRPIETLTTPALRKMFRRIKGPRRFPMRRFAGRKAQLV